MCKKLLAALLCAFTLLSLVAPFAVFAADDPMQVEFWNDLPGSAAATVTLKAKTGKYDLYWLDEKGEKLTLTLGDKVLPYTSLGKINVSSSGGVFQFQPFTVIPEGAAKLAALNSKDEVLGSFDIPAEKKQTSTPKYAYGVVSDVHFNYKDYGSKEDEAAVALRRALEYFTAAGAKLVSVTGDIGVYGEKDSYTGFKAVTDEFPEMTVLAAGGNHEVNGSREDVYGKNGFWFANMNVPVYKGTLEGATVAKNGIDFTYELPGTNEVYIYLHQMHWDGRAPHGSHLIEDEQMAWLGDQLEKFKDKNVILLSHTYLADDDDEHKDGEGDLENKAGNGYDFAYNPNAVEEPLFRELLGKYKNVTWYNGHSHFTYAMQRYNENLNIFDYYGSTATMIHVPSVTAPRTISDNDDGPEAHVGSMSEGALTFVCDGYQVMNGVNFYDGEIDSYGCYIIYDDATILQTGSAGALTYTYDKQLASLRIDGEGELSESLASLLGDSAAKIRRLYVAPGVTAVGKDCFKGLTALTTVEVKEGVLSIGEGAFEDCAAITALTLPGSLKTIGKNAFASLSEKVIFVFSGTSADYAALKVESGNDKLKATSFGSYLITWIIGDQSTLSRVKADSSPICPVTPVKAHENPEQKAWLFTGWVNEKGKSYKAASMLPAANADTTYIATFDEEVDRYVSGEIDKRVSWQLDRMNGTLTISGKGAMPDCSSQKGYKDYKNEIRTAIVKTGLTSVGKGTFARLSKLQTVVIEEGVKSLDMDCMAYCDSLTEVWLPRKITAVKQGALYNSDSIECIHYAGSEKEWEGVIKHTTKTYNDNIVGCGNVLYGDKAPTAESYTVTFKGADGSTLYTAEKIGWNLPAAFVGTIPEIEGKQFLYWDTPFVNVRDNLTVTAVYGDKAPSEEEPTEPADPEEPGKRLSPAVIGCIAGGAVLLIAAAVVIPLTIKKKKSK